MKNSIIDISILLVIISILSCQLVWGIDTGGCTQQRPYKEDEILVKFRPGIAEERIQEINDSMGAEVIRVMRTIGVHVLRIPRGESVEGMVGKYNALVEVEYAEPNYTFSIQK